MSQETPSALDVLTLPLFGERLIEASAGTGKTYTLAGLYFRLLLGLGGEAAYPKALSVEEILVVTFTEAATEELRDRIRTNIHALRLACLCGESENTLFSALLAQLPDKKLASKCLLNAERKMDEAAIYTIHGFCQRILGSHTFESGSLFDQELIEDERLLTRQACADFWRRYCYQLPFDLVKVISQIWSGPDALQRELAPYLQGEAPQLHNPPTPNETLLQRHQQILARIDDIKQQWQQAGSQIKKCILDSDVDKRSYSSRFLPGWVENITIWAETETIDYVLPKALERFAQSTLHKKTKKGTPAVHPVFSAIEMLLSTSLSLRDIVMDQALHDIRAMVSSEKRRRAALGFDDLLSRLDESLTQPLGEKLASAIRQRHPVALIDEFQDTDPQQYRIFRAIYGEQPNSGMLLIGDPKQAIYAFRGADIFTYMRARADIQAHYTLETNWRSSRDMVSGVNRLFQCVENPFFFSTIPFFPVQPAPGKQALHFEVEGVSQPALQFYLSGSTALGAGEYQQLMAQQCAMQIRDWLQAGQSKTACLDDGLVRRQVQASDICVLVRSRHEAALVRDALFRLVIPSIYLSNRDSIFTTVEAREVLWLLQAVLEPEQEYTLRSALVTSLLGFSAQQIDSLNQNEADWDTQVDTFIEFRQLWQQRGVLPMLRSLISHYRLAENMLASREGERRLTDFLHLGELLQHASATLESKQALVRWLSKQILQPNPQVENQQLRLESDRHLVQIVTIHKSKGLEYPLVWLPFICHFRSQPEGIYHDKHTYQALLDVNNGEESQQLAEEERLAEDLRLLYVALTRSIYHCSVGVAPLQRARHKSKTTDMHLSALGYLLQQGQEADASTLVAALYSLEGEGVAVTAMREWDGIPWQEAAIEPVKLRARECKRLVIDNWRVTSYSGLQQYGLQQQHNITTGEELFPRLDVDATLDQCSHPSEESKQAITPHTFPKGARPGTFLHSLLEMLDFTQPVSAEWLEEKLIENGMEREWAPTLQKWFIDLLHAPLNARIPVPVSDTPLMLVNIPAQQRIAELAFYLPIDAPLHAIALNSLAKHYDPLSANCPPLSFQQVQGMLKGFIDLVFCWHGRYYLLDYKSNWLGETASAYTLPSMETAMITHRYDLQYQLYTLALHRYLRHRVLGYDYDRHIGGIIYLFLRGVYPALPTNGIFTQRLPRAFVDQLDRLFSGELTPSGGAYDGFAENGAGASIA
ncbi:MAG: exodeoxyribonuclease V subunit beta [Candidatus Malihini olakiniferum]